ncbi:hypothetical protein JRC04_07685 [Mycolicibacterium sp. S2-37]|uniref:EspA/EspE family type VII secretion system effector n=1 Tax=Mycolicibacterium sp. S2-37 TaxID=2810297 RepID=UPI001A953C44|nr:EspA/EspE family type VII secretion system effector [Mycolicibacterium sp. S2-37]MBO0677340.1 hypothetical protein [Mycolicibacterium sp. S2-37]
MSYLAGIHDLGYIFSRVGGSVDSGVRQDWVGLGANIGAMAGKAVWYFKGQSGALKTALEKVGKSVLPTPTAIIDVTMVAVVVVDLLNGFGAPDNGSKFASGVDKYKNVDSKLELALPDSRDWSGAAADAYVTQVTMLRDLIAEIQALDKQMQTLVAAQGDYIKWAHQSLAILGFALVAGQGIALGLYLVPIIGPELSMLFQVVAALAAVTTVVTVETLTLSSSSNNSASVAKVAADYVALGQRAELGGSFATIQVAGADQTKVASFKAISDGLSDYSATPPVVTAKAGGTESQVNTFESISGGLSDYSATAPEVTAAPGGTESKVDTFQSFSGGLSAYSAMPPLSSLAARSDAVPEESRQVMAALGTPRSGVEPGVPVAADGRATTNAPVYAPPTMAQLNQMSAQMAKFSSNVGQPLNQAMGSVQQIVSMAQQGGGAEAGAAPMAQASGELPVDPVQEASAVDDRADVSDEADDSAAEAERGERAPMDAAAAAGDQELPDSARRVL